MTLNSSTKEVKGIKYISLYESSGYGNSAKAYLRALATTGIPLTWTPLIPGNMEEFYYKTFDGPSLGDPELDHFCNKQIDYDLVIMHIVPEYYPLLAAREPGKRLIGYTVWETDKIPHHWPALLNTMDQIFVPCAWNKDVFMQSGVTTRIDVIPHIFEAERSTSGTVLADIRESDYVFYTIGTWTARKAVLKTIKAYLDTFTADDQTLLVIKTTKQDFTKKLFWGGVAQTEASIAKLIRRYKRPARVKLICDEISNDDILDLHQRGDCYVSLCRSEGWGLGAFDAAGYGKPVIITGYGGHLDYLSGSELLVKYQLTPVVDAIGKKSYSKDQHWAEPDMQHASSLMRQAFEEKNYISLQATQLQENIKRHFNSKTIAGKLLRATRSD